MRFHLIDRIDVWEPHRTISGRKVTSIGETFWQTAGDGSLIMPPPLILEALCQLASWLLVLSSRFDQRAVLAAVDHVSYGDHVVPGDVLSVTATVGSTVDNAAIIEGSVDVEGKFVLRASGILCVLRAAADLEAVEATRRTAGHLLRTEIPG